MIVCLCHAVSDRTLRELAAEVPAGEVLRITKAGSGCGCCRETVARIVAEAAQEAAAPCRPQPCPDCPRARASA